MRDIYINPNFKKIDQGLIFNCATSVTYVGREVYGVIISPRCDIAHKKSMEIHYLPIVKLKDWIAVEGKTILVEKCKPIFLGKLKTEFEKLKITPSLLINNKPSELLSLLDKLIENKNKRAEISELVKKLIDLNKIENNTLPHNEICEIFEKETKQLKAIIKDLIENKKKEYYLLDPFDSKTNPKIVDCIFSSK